MTVVNLIRPFGAPSPSGKAFTHRVHLLDILSKNYYNYYRVKLCPQARQTVLILIYF